MDSSDGRASARRARIREHVVDANDGIIAVASIGEGFIGAGATKSAALLAVVAATIAGAIALAGTRFAEVANERDALQELIDEEARQLALSPAEELAELTAIFEGKGLSSELAARVAAELSQADPIAAHIEAEHGVDVRVPRLGPFLAAVGGALAFAAGAMFVIFAVWVARPDSRTIMVVLSAVAALVVTSLVGARWGNVPVRRTVLRTVVVGAIALTASYVVGTLFHF